MTGIMFSYAGSKKVSTPAIVTRAPCRELQRFAAYDTKINRVPPIVQDVLRSPGQPLDANTHEFMQARFGHNFGDVRVHTDSVAAQSAHAVNALAYTVGHDMVFDSGQYAPSTSAGQKLIAHELTHVVQQRDTSTGTSMPSGVSTPGDVNEREADAAARSFTQGLDVTVANLGRVPAQIQRMDIKHCSEDDAKQVRNAASAADSTIVKAVNDIPSQPQLTTYFGKSAYDHSNEISLNLLYIRDGLKDATIECDNPASPDYYDDCPVGTSGYSHEFWGIGIGNIHICPTNFNLVPVAERIDTLVHEGSHRYIGTGDYAYYYGDCKENAKTRAMSDEERRDNADSYGCFIQSLYKST